MGSHCSPASLVVESLSQQVYLSLTSFLSFTCMERLLIHHQELEKMAAAALTGEECSPTRQLLTSQLAHAARARLTFSSQDRDIDFFAALSAPSHHPPALCPHTLSTVWANHIPVPQA